MTPEPEPTLKVLTVKEVAATLRIDAQDVGRLIRSGRLRAFRVTPGKTAPWRILERDLLELIEAKIEEATQ